MVLLSKYPDHDDHTKIVGFSQRAAPGAEAGRRPAVAGTAAFSKKADVVFSYIHRESLMLICRGNLFRTKLGT